MAYAGESHPSSSAQSFGMKRCGRCRSHASGRDVTPLRETSACLRAEAINRAATHSHSGGTSGKRSSRSRWTNPRGYAHGAP